MSALLFSDWMHGASQKSLVKSTQKNGSLSSNSKSSQQNFKFLSSTNLIYREQLPPEYSLPTLIPGYSPNLRGINTIDNEEQIPDVDFRDALTKFDVDPTLIQNMSPETSSSSFPSNDEKLRKTYSENEVSKYDWLSGRRKSLASATNLIQNWDSNYNHENTKWAFSSRRNVNEGIIDEYIPNFESFNLAKFGIEENAIYDDFDVEATKEQELFHKKGDSINNDDNNDNVTINSNILNKSRPIEIHPNNKQTFICNDNQNGIKPEDCFKVSNESFKIAASPERDGDRMILSSIPKNFQSLSFSYRRQMLTDLLPESLKNDNDYKNHITKILRKNSASTSTLSSVSPLFRSANKRQRGPDPNTNELGSILLDKWKLGRVFNSGSFGIIRECFNINDVEDVKAVKIISIKKNLKNLRKCQSEVYMWSKLQHETIISLLDLKITADNIFLLMPLYDEGSLYDRVKLWEANKVHISERFDSINSYIKAIIDAIEFLHHQGIHHGDIKLENFLLDNNVPKLCDFGITNFDLDSYNNIPGPKELNGRVNDELKCVVTLLTTTNGFSESFNCPSPDIFGSTSAVNNTSKLSPKTTSSIYPTTKANELEHNHSHIVDINIGSLPYAAPELLQPCPVSIDRKTDIWAIGVLLYTLVIMKLPFWHVYEPRLKLKILDNHWESEEWKTALIEYPKLQNIHSIISDCLVERTKRCNIDDIVKKLSED